MSLMSMFGGDFHGSSKRYRPSICLFLTCFVLFSEVNAFGVDWFNREGATVFSLLNPQTVVSSGQYVCQTEVCNSEANRVKDYMDLNSDPCSDFYQFACGGFMEKYKDVPRTVSQYTLTERRISDQIAELLDTDDEMPECFKDVQNIYKSCRDLDSDMKNIIPEIKEVMQAAGGYPLLEGSNWDPDRFDIFGLAPGQTINLMPFFFFIVHPSHSNNGFVLQLDPPHPQMPPTSLKEGLENQRVKEMFDTLVSVAELLGADADAADEAYLELLEYQTQLAEINSNCSYEPKMMTVQELSELVPSIPWLDYFRSILPDSFNIDVDEPIKVAHSSCLPEIVELVENTPKRVLANFMGTILSVSAMTVFRRIGFDLSDIIPEFKPRFNAELTRSEICMENLLEIFEAYIAPFHATKYSDEETNEKLEAILSYVKSAVVDIIDSSSWLDPETRNIYLDWSSNFTTHVVSPHELDLNDVWEKMGVEMNTSPDSFFSNIVELVLNMYRFVAMSREENRDYREENILIRPWYNNGHGKIIVPVSYQQAPLFDHNRPNYINFGMMGSTFANVFMESMYLANYRLSHNKAQCITDQLSSDQEFYSASIDSRSFAAPAVVDAVFNAYSRWVEAGSAEGTLPELGLNKNQILWLTGGQMMCYKFEKGSWLEFPAASMLNSVVMNSERFAKDFSCASGSPMNPAEKCQVW